jgi:hypothetical protein
MDADGTAIFYNRPEDLLGIGVIVSIILLIVGIRWRRFLSALSRNRLIILVLALGLFGPGFIGLYYFRGGQPAQEIVLNSSGMWCRSWHLWLNWREITFVDEIDTTGDVGGKGHGRWATFDLTTEALANHPWPIKVRSSGKASCSIDYLALLWHF